MNYLQLCQHVRQECGVQGQGPSAVTNQTGMLKKIVEWVRDADLYIQSYHADWDFLWAEMREETVAGSDTLVKPTDFGQWDLESFGVDRGATNGRKLNLITYKEWREDFSPKTNQAPHTLAIMPNNNLRLTQPADGIYEIYAVYFKAVTQLTADADVPPYPARFHRAIVAKAKMWFFADQESPNQYKEAEEEFNEWFEKLQAFAAPGQTYRSFAEPKQMSMRPA